MTCGARYFWSPRHDVAHLIDTGASTPTGVEINEAICAKPAGHALMATGPYDEDNMHCTGDGTCEWPESIVTVTKWI